jgi:hypothetical protein
VSKKQRDMRSFAVNGVVDKSVSLEKLQHGLEGFGAFAHEAVLSVGSGRRPCA